MPFKTHFKRKISSAIQKVGKLEALNLLGMSCPRWQWHRTGSSWFPVWTLQVAPLWCDLGFFLNSSGNKAVLNLHPESKSRQSLSKKRIKSLSFFLGYNSGYWDSTQPLLKTNMNHLFSALDAMTYQSSLVYSQTCWFVAVTYISKNRKMMDFSGRQNKISLMCVVLLQCKSSGILSSTSSSSNNARKYLSSIETFFS